MNNNKTNTIAVFDFDGTITTKDTLFDFVRFSLGRVRLLAGLFAIAPILVAFKLKTVSNTIAKQEMLSHFWAQRDYVSFLELCENYKEGIAKIVKPEALEKIKWHQQEGHKVIIISASVVDWIVPWAKSVGVEEVYGTVLEVKDGKVTGRLAGANCHGQEKVNRLLEVYSDRAEYQLYMYGDSRGDREMLAFADFPFYRKF